MKVANIRGIDVHIHWTFWILILFYLLTVAQSSGLVDGLLAVAFILGVFLCVLLHEFGHSAAAAWYGIPTRDITLLPIGGVARLERMPEKPLQELVVALAGPAVNVVIALVLLVPVTFQVLAGWHAPALGSQAAILVQLLYVNIILVAFNLLPAFPMDGGRVLRSLLAIRYGHFRATQIAARVGRWMSLIIAVWAIYNWNVMLLLLAGFVFMAGTAELAQVTLRNMQANFETRGPAGYDSRFGGRTPWSPSEPGTAGTTFPHGQPHPSAGADVIDATEFRQIK